MCARAGQRGRVGFVGATGALSCTDDHWLLCCCLRPPLLTGAQQDGRHRSWCACAPRPSARQVVPPAALRPASRATACRSNSFPTIPRGRRRPSEGDNARSSGDERQRSPWTTPVRVALRGAARCGAARRCPHGSTTAAQIARHARVRPSIATPIDVSPRAKPRKYRARCERAQPFESPNLTIRTLFRIVLPVLSLSHFFSLFFSFLISQ